MKKALSLLIIVILLSLGVIDSFADARDLIHQDDPACCSTDHSPSPGNSGFHIDYDGCGCCIGCACHAPLTSEPLTVSLPVVETASFHLADILCRFPEVYIPLFIPPDIA